MTKLEILEKLKDFKDTDEIVFTKKVSHWVPVPEESWDEDVEYYYEDVTVDSFRVDNRRLDKYRIAKFYNIDNNFKVLCLNPNSKFVEEDFLNKNGEKVIHYPILMLNYKSFNVKSSFNTKDALVTYVNNFVGKASGHKYNESEIIWGTGRD